MMDIETECFKVQRHFLKTGKVLDDDVASVMPSGRISYRRPPWHQLAEVARVRADGGLCGGFDTVPPCD